jgi:hypothetical protein
MTVDYPNALAKSFTLSKFWFGCIVISRNVVVAPPKGCKLTLSGYPVDNSKGVQTQEFRFEPTLLGLPVAIEAEMIEATVDSGRFRDLKTVEVKVEPLGVSLPSGSFVGARVDDVAATLKTVGGQCTS